MVVVQGIFFGYREDKQLDVADTIDAVSPRLLAISYQQPAIEHRRRSDPGRLRPPAYSCHST